LPLRARLQISVQLGAVKTGEEDAAAKKKVAELTEATLALKRAVTAAAQASGACNAALDQVHTDMRTLYPASGELAPALSSLCGRSEAVTSHAAMDAATADLTQQLVQQVEEKIKAVKALVDARAQLREEVAHYTKKLAEIEPGAGADPAKVKRVAENKVKLAEMQKNFESTEAAVVPVLASLDADLAAMTGDHFRGYLVAAKGAAQALASELQQGLEGVPPPAAAAAEAPAA
jgi:DNA repair ATPase RecN